MLRRLSATRGIAAGLWAFLVPEVAHATGEGLAIVRDLWVVAALVGAVSVAIASAAAKTGSRWLLAASVVIGAIPGLLGVAGALSFWGAAGFAGLTLAVPFFFIVAAQGWAWSVARRKVKDQQRQNRVADAWIAQKKREAEARRSPGQPTIPSNDSA